MSRSKPSVQGASGISAPGIAKSDDSGSKHMSHGQKSLRKTWYNPRVIPLQGVLTMAQMLREETWDPDPLIPARPGLQSNKQGCQWDFIMNRHSRNPRSRNKEGVSRNPEDVNTPSPIPSRLDHRDTVFFRATRKLQKAALEVGVFLSFPHRQILKQHKCLCIVLRAPYCCTYMYDMHVTLHGT